MTTQAIVCGSCAAEVPYGRLSCPSCGELLASVAGGRRRSHNGTSSTATPATVYAVLAAGEPAADDDADGAFTDDDGDDVDEAADSAEPNPDDAWTDPSAELAASATAAATWAVAGHAPATTSAPPAPPAPTVPAWPSTAPGAYVPPPPPAQVAGPAAPARAWGGYQDVQAVRPPARDVVASASPPDRPSADATADEADSVRVDEFVRWLSVAGSALSAVGFLLPWSSTVIGSTGGGYLDRWGLGTPGHVVVALGLLVVLALALVRNPIPVWVRVGLPGLGLGSLLVGLVWPYLVGPLGSGPGVLIVVAGAMLLGAAGVVAIAVDRNAGSERGV